MHRYRFEHDPSARRRLLRWRSWSNAGRTGCSIRSDARWTPMAGRSQQRPAPGDRRRRRGARYALAQQLGAEHIHCVATAGIRRARNGEALKAAPPSDLGDGFEMEILTGEQEAEASPSPGRSGRQLLIRDRWSRSSMSGGGSSEIVAGIAPDEVRWWESLPIGSGDLTARWLAQRPTDGRRSSGAAR